MKKIGCTVNAWTRVSSSSDWCEGRTVSGAARELGIPRTTALSWGARDAAFAERLAAAREDATNGAVQAGPVDRHEWEQLLAAACRQGNVAALRLWREVHPSDSAVEQTDDLAKLRALHARVEAAR